MPCLCTDAESYTSASQCILQSRNSYTLSSHLVTVLIVEIFSAASMNMCVKHPHFRVRGFFILSQYWLYWPKLNTVKEAWFFFINLFFNWNANKHAVVVYYKLISFSDIDVAPGDEALYQSSLH